FTQTPALNAERAALAFDRGDIAAAEDFVNQMRAELPSDQSTIEVPRWIGLFMGAALLADHAGDGDKAAEELARVLTEKRLSRATEDLCPAVVLAAQVAWRNPPSDPDWPALVRRARDRMYRRAPIGEAWFHDVEANLARVQGRDTPADWRAAVD